MNAINKSLGEFELNTGVNSGFIENTLTKDITTLEAIFDLVDNSIDAARSQVINDPSKIGDDGLPNNYEGFSINIRIGNDSVCILDNCSGIDRDTLINRVLFTANESRHDYGIGQYGIGLKRSLLKIGSNFSISVDNGESLFKTKFSNDSFGGNTEHKVYAQEYQSKGRVKSLITISDLKSEIRDDVHYSLWVENAAKKISTRFGTYIKKGLKISLRNSHNKQTAEISPVVPSLRTNAKFLPIKKEVEINGVKVVIETGIHQGYRFSSEPDHSVSVNSTLTKEFGIYFACNDRVIIDASTDHEHGWKAKWHSEYNGFVCWVRFISKDPSKLPWNTSKSDLRTDSSLFLRVRELIQPIADQYRSEVRSQYLKKTAKTKNGNQAKPSPAEKSKKQNSAPKKSDVEQTRSPKTNNSASEKNSSTNTNKSIPNTTKHTAEWDTLLPDTIVTSEKNEVLNNMIIEGRDIKIESFPYASAALYRSLIESSLKEYATKTNNFQKIKDHYYSTGEGIRKNHDDEQKRKNSIDSSMTINWLLANDSHLFHPTTKNALKICLQKAKNHLKKLNGVVHGIELISHHEIINIRNETIVLLEFLISLGKNQPK